eukprot:7378263-Prymnesium_polylepis.1
MARTSAADVAPTASAAVALRVHALRDCSHRSPPPQQQPPPPLWPDPHEPSASPPLPRSQPHELPRLPAAAGGRPGRRRVQLGAQRAAARRRRARRGLGEDEDARLDRTLRRATGTSRWFDCSPLFPRAHRRPSDARTLSDAPPPKRRRPCPRAPKGMPRSVPWHPASRRAACCMSSVRACVRACVCVCLGACVCLPLRTAQCHARGAARPRLKAGRAAAPGWRACIGETWGTARSMLSPLCEEAAPSHRVARTCPQTTRPSNASMRRRGGCLRLPDRVQCLGSR